MHQLRKDAAKIFRTVAAAEEWVKKPSLTWPKTNLNSVKPKLLRPREHHLTCLKPEFNRKFSTVAESNYHMHIAHTMLNNSAIEDESTPFACPIAPTTTTPATKNKTRIATITPEFKCPFVQRYCQRKKKILHCYSRHRFSVLKGMFLNETTVGTTKARWSESRLGLPGGSGPR